MARGAHVRRVQGKGVISFRGRLFHLTKALRGYPVALRPTKQDGRWRVYFCHQYVSELAFAPARRITHTVSTMSPNTR